MSEPHLRIVIPECTTIDIDMVKAAPDLVPIKLFSVDSCLHTHVVHLENKRREHMAADAHRLFMSVEEYLELDRKSLDARYEYIDGVVTMLAGGPTNHSRISVNVVSLFQAALRGSLCEVFNSDLRVSISSTRYVLPDASVSCDPGDLEGANDIIYSPRVIVEVLSPSTEATDRGKKFRYYQSCLSIQALSSSKEDTVMYEPVGAMIHATPRHYIRMDNPSSQPTSSHSLIFPRKNRCMQRL